MTQLTHCVERGHSSSSSFSFFLNFLFPNDDRVKQLPVATTFFGIKAGPPLDLSFWSFLTFLHHGIEEVERHLL